MSSSRVQVTSERLEPVMLWPLEQSAEWNFLLDVFRM